jgi:hypothetical protein
LAQGSAIARDHWRVLIAHLDAGLFVDCTHSATGALIGKMTPVSRRWFVAMEFLDAGTRVDSHAGDSTEVDRSISRPSGV